MLPSAEPHSNWTVVSYFNCHFSSLSSALLSWTSSFYCYFLCLPKQGRAHAPREYCSLALIINNLSKTAIFLSCYQVMPRYQDIFFWENVWSLTSISWIYRFGAVHNSSYTYNIFSCRPEMGAHSWRSRSVWQISGRIITQQMETLYTPKYIDWFLFNRSQH